MDKVVADAKRRRRMFDRIIWRHDSTLLEMLVPGEYQGEAIDNCSVTT